MRRSGRRREGPVGKEAGEVRSRAEGKRARRSRHRRGHGGTAGKQGARTGRNWRRGGDAGPLPTHPALPCPGAAPALRGGAGDRGRIHVPAAPAAQPRDRRRSCSMRRARTGSPAGGLGSSGSPRLQHLLPRLPTRLTPRRAAPGTATAYGVPPRPRLRPPRQSDTAPPARVTAETAGPHPSRSPSLGKADLPPSRR